LTQALVDAYRPLLARDQFPVAVLHIRLPSQEVDVNVHPAKAWVRFRSPRLCQEALFIAVQEALRSSRVIQSQPGLSVGGERSGSPWSGAEPPGVATESAGPQAALFHEQTAPFRGARFGAVVGQLQETFIVAATDDEVFFIDQHVAHERVLFEQLQRGLADRPLSSQELLFPQLIELGAGRSDLLRDFTSVLETLGFALESFGGSSVVLRAVPLLLKGEEPRRLIEALLDEVSAPARDEAVPALRRALAFVACRAAIKAHAPLQRDEMIRLLSDLAATETPYFCPHGRPIVSRLSLKEIKRELGRTW
jgi:DNA mismatch repair protein MutL